MKIESAYLGGGVYVALDQNQTGQTITLSYGGRGAPSVVLNPAIIENLWVFLKKKPHKVDDDMSKGWIDKDVTI